MGKLSVLLVLLGACAVDEPGPKPVPATFAEAMQVETADDVCALVAALPDDDTCSLACDPVALAERMVADGVETGRCYVLRCMLTDEIDISVGVCLP